MGPSITRNNHPPVPLAVKDRNIPADLRNRLLWVCWNYVWNETKKRKDGSGEKGEWDKPPFSACTGKNASTTERATWDFFSDAMAAYRKGSFAGVGFVPTPEDGLTFIDLDHCRDPETREVAPW